MRTYFKKIIGFAAFLWIAGALGYGWVQLDNKLQEKKLHKNQQIMSSKLDKLDKLIQGESGIEELSNALPDEKLEKSITKQFANTDELKPYILSAAFISLSLGTFILLSVGTLKIYRHFTQNLPMSIKLKTMFSSNSNESSPTRARPRSEYVDSEDNEQTIEKGVDGGRMKLGHYKGNYDGPERRKGQRRVADKPFDGPDRRKAIDRRKTESKKSKAKLESDFLTSRSTHDFANINALYCDADSLQQAKQTNIGTKMENSETELISQLEAKIRESIASGYSEQAVKVDDSLKAQNEHLEKQINELKIMAESVRKQATGNNGNDGIINDLAAQISAIREFAAEQQNKNEKLQEGYDWTIIRNFCMRFIRCIDNLDTRIANAVDEQDAYLKEIKDELIFALESSGVEQFKPEVNSDFNGQERTAEVIREKVKAEKPADKGKIAEVVKPGYHYVIDEQNEKIVRTAKVKLYE